MKYRCIKYGNDINTDLIIAGKYTKTLVASEMALHAMEDLDPEFHQKVVSGRRILVAGRYFGCGSSREQAPVALKAAGIACVVAESFSRIFYRNAVNIGLPIVECDTRNIEDGDVLEYELGLGVLHDITKDISLEVTPLPDIMVAILNSGGIMKYLAPRDGS